MPCSIRPSTSKLPGTQQACADRGHDHIYTRYSPRRGATEDLVYRTESQAWQNWEHLSQDTVKMRQRMREGNLTVDSQEPGLTRNASCIPVSGQTPLLPQQHEGRRLDSRQALGGRQVVRGGRVGTRVICLILGMLHDFLSYLLCPPPTHTHTKDSIFSTTLGTAEKEVKPWDNQPKQRP